MHHPIRDLDNITHPDIIAPQPPPQNITFAWRCASCLATGTITAPIEEAHKPDSITWRIRISHARKRGSNCRWNEENVRLRKVA